MKGVATILFSIANSQWRFSGRLEARDMRGQAGMESVKAWHLLGRELDL